MQGKQNKTKRTHIYKKHWKLVIRHWHGQCKQIVLYIAFDVLLKRKKKGR